MWEGYRKCWGRVEWCVYGLLRKQNASKITEPIYWSRRTNMVRSIADAAAQTVGRACWDDMEEAIS
jgi:hypothetical protein